MEEAKANGGLGKAIQGKRDKVFLATKAVMRGVPYTYENTILSVEESLQRLGTDYVHIPLNARAFRVKF